VKLNNVKKSALTSKKYVSITKIRWLILLKEIITVYAENYTELTDEKLPTTHDPAITGKCDSSLMTSYWALG
jgi:hypothetical protein